MVIMLPVKLKLKENGAKMRHYKFIITLIHNSARINNADVWQKIEKLPDAAVPIEKLWSVVVINLNVHGR